MSTEIEIDASENRDVELIADTMRCINEYLTDFNDTIALANVNEDWAHALQKNVDDIWTLEWELFKEANKHKPWFTETVYNVPFKTSRFQSSFNAFRKLVKKDEKQYQSFRQRVTETVEIIENPTPVQLLIANGQAKMDAMSEEEWIYCMKKRPSVKLFMAKAGCITAAPILAALGIALLPLTVLTACGYTAYSKITGNYARASPMGQYGIMMIAGAPTAVPWACAGMALYLVVSKKNLRKIPDMYALFGEYNKKRVEIDAQKPTSEKDLSLEYINQ